MKSKSFEFNYALFLPIFLFYLLSIGVQYGAAVYDQVPYKTIVLKQVIFCIASLGLLLLTQKNQDSVIVTIVSLFLCHFISNYEFALQIL